MTLSEARRWQNSPDPEVRAAAERRLGARSASRARTAPRRRLGAEKKRLSKEERNAKVAAIRAVVFERAGRNCEFCGVPFSLVGPGEWHHVIGAGLRRHRESAETTAAICRPCHTDWERGSLLVLAEAVSWAARHGFSEAKRAIERRVAKVEEARASSVRRAEGGR